MIVTCCALVARGWNCDHRALRVAEAVVAHGTVDKPADAHMLLRADHEQRRCDGFGHQAGPNLAGDELQFPSGVWLHRVEYGRDRFAVGGVDL